MAIIKTLIGNIKGPQGQQGEKGEQGVQGPQGVPGTLNNVFVEVPIISGASVDCGQLKGAYVVVVKESYSYTDEEGNQQTTTTETEIPIIIIGTRTCANTIYSIGYDDKEDNHITVRYYTSGRIQIYQDANNITTTIVGIYQLT